jgi:predicted GIY-YIG superfamily endonuclease
VENEAVLLSEFNRWYVLADISYADVPQNGCFVYILRKRANRETLYIGSASELYRRIFVNYLGGAGGQKTKRIHNELMHNIEVGAVEIAWIKCSDEITAERRLLGEYLVRYGCLPVWNAMEQAIRS